LATSASGQIHNAARTSFHVTTSTTTPRRSPRKAVCGDDRRVMVTLVLITAFLGSLLVGGRADAAPGDDFSQNFQAFAVGQPWANGTVQGNLHSVFNGYGSVGVVRDGSKVLNLTPKASMSQDETHAALVTTVPTFEDFELTVRMKTVEQLRKNTPNPWEVGWVVWNYTDNKHFYYLTLKPNGWEFGKADPAYPGAQRFVATGSDRTFPLGKWNTVRVRQVGNTVSVLANGDTLVTFTDNERPYTRGSVGFYTEDARVNFDNISVRSI
jgi:hypothetical protein